MISGIQTRTCTDKNHCGTNTGMPATTQTCTYTQPFANFGAGENLQQQDKKNESQGQQEEPKQEETTKEQNKQSSTPTGAVTGGFFSSTTGKVTLGIFVLLITASLIVVLKNAIKNRKNPPQQEFSQ